MPHDSIKELPEGYSRGDNPKETPAIGLSDPYQIYTTEQDDAGDLVLKVSGKVYGGLTSNTSFVPSTPCPRRSRCSAEVDPFGRTSYVT